MNSINKCFANVKFRGGIARINARSCLGQHFDHPFFFSSNDFFISLPKRIAKTDGLYRNLRSHKPKRGSHKPKRKRHRDTYKLGINIQAIAKRNNKAKWIIPMTEKWMIQRKMIIFFISIIIFLLILYIIISFNKSLTNC